MGMSVREQGFCQGAVINGGSLRISFCGLSVVRLLSLWRRQFPELLYYRLVYVDESDSILTPDPDQLFQIGGPFVFTSG
jgi:hypothetical protein